MKRLIIFIALTTIASLAFVVLTYSFGDNKFEGINSSNNERVEGYNIPETQYRDSESGYSDNHDKSYDVQTPQPTETYLSYEDGWCSLEDLNPIDRNFALDQVQDWKVLTGQIPFTVNENIKYAGLENAYLTRPYIDIDRESLLSSVEAGDPFAMLAAIERRDISSKYKRKMAEELLILGYMGKAIQYLIMDNMAFVSVSYEENGGKITNEIESKMIDSLKYAHYALENHDASGFSQLLNIIMSDPSIDNDVNPFIVLNEVQLEKIKDESDDLAENISKARDKMNVSEIDEDLHKIGAFKARSDIALMLSVMSPYMAPKIDVVFGEAIEANQINNCSITKAMPYY